MLFILDILKEILFFFNEVAIYLLLGFAVAGILHVLFPESVVKRHLGNDSFGSVIKATVFGIPLPLCSCGVVPTAASLKKSGASNGASISFLISTPQIGADSFLITYSLLGWIFGVFRIAASLITAMTAGILVNIFSKKNYTETASDSYSHDNFKDRLKGLFGYIEYELLGSIAGTLVVGVIIAGIISAVIPAGFFEQYLNYPFLSMIIMLAVGIPMYVCAAASTPIAASLILKGMSPGAALVFLLTGPATNAVTISMVVKMLGKRSAVIYLLSISIISLILGYGLNAAVAKYGLDRIITVGHPEMLSEKLKISASILLALMIGWNFFKTKVLLKLKRKQTMKNEQKMRINVEGMTCMHCAGNVRKAVESAGGVSVDINLEDKCAEFELKDQADIEKIKSAVINAGYTLA